MADARTCVFCLKPTADGSNYCDGDCLIARAKAAGGVVHTPNGLPIGCVMADGTMLEIEHGDHPDYMFPVDVDFIGEVTDECRRGFEMIYGRPPKDDDEIRWTGGETHALVYTDGAVALTMYEYSYALWSIHDGEGLGGRYQMAQRLSEASCTAIRGYLAKKDGAK